MTFKVGDKIRRVSNAAPWAPIGYETVVTGVPENLTYTDIKGNKGIYARTRDWELVQDGPVRTVTRQEIVPGTYDGVVVSYEHDHRLTVHFMVERPSPDALTRAAAVITALADALKAWEAPR